MYRLFFSICFAFLIAQMVHAQGDSLLQIRKELVRKFYREAWEGTNYAFADSLFADPYIRHDASGPAEMHPDKQGLIAKDIGTEFTPDQFRPDVLVADGDYVIAHWHWKAHPQGIWRWLSFNGLIDETGVNTYRFKGRKVVEIWNNRDDLTFVQQAGVVRTFGVVCFMVGILLSWLFRFVWRRVRTLGQSNQKI